MNESKQFRFRSFLPFGLAASALVVACEGVLHVRALRERLPLVSPYYVAEVDTQAELVEDALRELEQIDCLFIGSSVVGHGVQAEFFDREVTRLTGRDMTSFNGWQCALMPSCVEFYLHRFWLRRFRPKVILQGVRLLFLRSDYEPREHPALKRGRYEQLWMDPSRASCFRLWGLDHVMLYRYRGSLSVRLRNFKWPPMFGHSLTFDSRGGVVHDEVPSATEGSAISPAAPPLRREDLFHVYADAPSERYSRGLAALRRVGRWCQDHNIDYVLVNIPEHADRFSGDDGKRIYENYLADLQRVADAVGAECVDVTRGDTSAYGDDDFVSDRVHMNTAGSRRFTAALAAVIAALNIGN